MTTITRLPHNAFTIGLHRSQSLLTLCYLTIAKSILGITFLLIAGCGGGGGSDADNSIEWVPNEFLPASNFRNQCTTVAENFWLRSLFNDIYFWYEDIVDADPNNFSTSGYFFNLVTDEITASGKFKDEFSTFVDTDDFNAMIIEGEEIGYGIRWTFSEIGFGGDITVGFVVSGSVADSNGIERGDKLVSVNSVRLDGSNRNDALLNVFPFGEGETHRFVFEPLSGPAKIVSMQSETNVIPAVQHTQIVVQGLDRIGYLQFNDHTSVAEAELVSAFQTFSTGNVNELILDMRYNPGGFLDVASRVAYMIAGDAPTIAKTFEQLVFNNKHPSINPVVGGPIQPTPFFSTWVNPTSNLIEALPTLDLNRVIIIADHYTCSASESIINGLAGIGIDVEIIGKTTCGKPFGFYGLDNCGTTYLPVQFQGENHLGFGDYADGFAPANDPSPNGVRSGGCFVEDDFNNAMGDESEGRFAAALNFIATNNCPAVTATSIANARSRSLATGNQFRSSLIEQQPLRAINASQFKSERGLNIRR